MAYAGTTYKRPGYNPAIGSQGSTGDISPRTLGDICYDMLERAHSHMVFEQFGKSKSLSKGKGQQMFFRRFKKLPPATTALTEGVTPASQKLTAQDYVLPLTRIGFVVEISDEIEDHHDDPVIQEGVEVVSEQMAESLELLRFGGLVAGTSVFFANGTARTAVNIEPNKDLFVKIQRFLKRKDAKPITKFVGPTVEFGTVHMPKSYIAVCHTDLESSLEKIIGWKKPEDYSTKSPFENEIGSLLGFRFLTSTLLTPWADAGGDKGAMISTTGVKADVYPILIFAENAYAISAFKGMNALTPSVIPPSRKDKSDVLGQRGYIGAKGMAGACILNDDWFVRAEVAVKA
jgi:N4-gp56 family major capsid protein